MKKLLSIFVFALLTVVSCKKSSVDVPVAGAIVDYGFIGGATFDAAESEFQPMVHHNNKVLVATSDGLWKIDLNTKAWQRAGLDGKEITCLYQHPSIAGKLFAGVVSNGPSEKSLYISNDAGGSWQPAPNLPFDNYSKKYERFSYITARPGYPDHLYANLTSVTIAISKDGGLSWNRMNYMDESHAASYNCPIHFIPNNPNEIFIGAESPLDDAWLGKWSIDPNDPVRLTGFTKIADMTLWQNRRPNQIESFNSVPNSLYIGQEGALSKLMGSQTKFIFKANEHSGVYAYVKGIWIDPRNQNHIIFGGAPQSLDDCDCLSLFETYDEGANIIHIKDKLGMDFPVVVKILATSTYPIILLADRTTKKLKLIRYQPHK